MKKNSCFFFPLIVISCLFSCKSKDDRFTSYIDKNCNFDAEDTCYINLKNIFKVDYDTMFVFEEYTQLQGIRLILGINSYNSTNILMPKGMLVEDSHNKIILIKNHKIVFEKDGKYPYFYEDGVIVNKTGTFDGETYVHSARMYTSPRFLVTKKDDPKGHIKKYFYILENVGVDGRKISSDTINK